MNDEDDILAAEIALGLLEGAEAETARRRVTAEPALATRVDWWREQFENLAVDDSAQPGASVWPRIAARLPGNDNAAREVRRWQAAAFAATLVAVVLAGAIALRPNPAAIAPPVSSRSTPLLLASLTGERGVAATVAYDKAAARLTVVPGAMDLGEHDAELWIIPAGGTARSLGTIDPARPTVNPARADARAMIGAGATFALTLERHGGSPTGKAQGPVIASGIIAGT